MAVGYGAALPLVPALLDTWMLGAPGEKSASHPGMLAAVYMLAVGAPAPFLGHALRPAWPPPRAWVDSMTQAYAMRLAAGGFAGAVLPIVFATAAELEDIGRRASWLAWLGAASLLGFLAGLAITGGIDAFLAGGFRGPRAGALFSGSTPP